MPCVPEPHGPAQSRVAVAADPHRDPPVAVRGGVRPRCPHVPQMLVGQSSSTLERDPEGGELLPCPAHSHAEDQSAAAQLLQVGRHPGGEQRVPVGSDEDRRAESDPGGEAGQPGQGGEGLVEGCWIALGDVGRDGDVVRDHQQVVAQALHGLGPAPQDSRVAAGAEIEDVDSDLHDAEPKGAQDAGRASPS